MLHPRIVIAAWSIGILFSTLLISPSANLPFEPFMCCATGFHSPKRLRGAWVRSCSIPTSGWRATAHYEQEVFDTTQRGVVYRVHRSQGEQGFRSDGDVQARRPELLVMGIPLPRLRQSPMTRHIMRCSARSWDWKSLPMAREAMAPCKNI